MTSKRYRLEKIVRDKISGSTDLLLKLNKLMLENINDKKFLSTAAETVKKEMSHFAVIKDYAEKLNVKINSSDRESLNEFLTHLDNEFKDRYFLLYKNAHRYIKKISKLMTISNSGTLRNFFELWGGNNKKLHIYLCESRPKLEGRNFAQSLLKKNIQVTFFADASAAFFMNKVDAVFTGADSILKDGSIVNKTGSKNLAVLCKYYGKPFYVISLGNKFSSKKSFNILRENPAEIWDYEDEKLTIQNFYFEIVEKDLITAIITDKK